MELLADGWGEEYRVGVEKADWVVLDGVRQVFVTGSCRLVHGGDVYVDSRVAIGVLPDLLAEFSWEAQEGWFGRGIVSRSYVGMVSDRAAVTVCSRCHEQIEVIYFT